MTQALRQKEKVMEENQCCLFKRDSHFIRFTKLIMVATDDVIGNVC